MPRHGHAYIARPDRHRLGSTSSQGFCPDLGRCLACEKAGSEPWHLWPRRNAKLDTSRPRAEGWRSEKAEQALNCTQQDFLRNLRNAVADRSSCTDHLKCGPRRSHDAEDLMKSGRVVPLVQSRMPFLPCRSQVSLRCRATKIVE